MGLWDRIRGKKPEQKPLVPVSERPARIKLPAPPRTPARSYDSQPIIKTPEQYLRDGGDRDRRRREAEDYDRTVDGLRRDREALARDNDRLRRDRDAAFGGAPYGGYPVGYGYLGDGLYHGDDVIDVTGPHHHHHHDDGPDVVIVENHVHEAPSQAYDQEDDRASHVREDYEADQSAAETQTQTDEQFYGRDNDFYGDGNSAPDPEPARETSSWSDNTSYDSSSNDNSGE